MSGKFSFVWQRSNSVVGEGRVRSPHQKQGGTVSYLELRLSGTPWIVDLDFQKSLMCSKLNLSGTKNNLKKFLSVGVL